MRASIRLGSLFGIPLGINYTWFIIFVLVTLSLALHYFPSTYPQWPARTYWVIGIATSVIFFASVVAHELAHSLVSMANGVPVKSITLFIFGGVAEIGEEARRPSGELVMALAGPLASLVIAVFFTLMWLLLTPINEPLAALSNWLIRINLLLAIFNLIPGFPLDGGRVLRSIIWWISGNYRQATRFASYAGQGIAYLFILGGIFIMFSGDWLNGLWFALIGWFLDSAAAGGYRQAVLQDNLRGYTAGDLMTQDCVMVPLDLSVGDLVRHHILPTARRCFIVTQGDHLEGIMTLHNVKSIPQDRWDITSVSQAMTPASQLKTAHLKDNALSVLQKMDEADISQMPVVEGGKVVGMVARDNLLRFIRMRAELGA
ncbi:MAG: site-2 protease family protein [Chloroflexi bacterium]|nr:site-2 protease family protein [Chloroflexota bacterium]